jgi:hypothetical protein
MLRRAQDQPYRLPLDVLEDGVTYTQSLASRVDEFEYADLESCLAMTYQAAVLHNLQHAAASLALCVAVLESLTHELFLVYGLVGNGSPRPFANARHNVARVSNSEFRDLTFNNRLVRLRDGGLIDSFHYTRIESARVRRNRLMHRGESVTLRESGDGLTAARDIWSKLIDMPFELITSWAHRR